eukprot:341658-Rhodomonas_salina.1
MTRVRDDGSGLTVRDGEADEEAASAVQVHAERRCRLHLLHDPRHLDRVGNRADVSARRDELDQSCGCWWRGARRARVWRKKRR